MELFDKMHLSNDPLIYELLLNKNDFIKFLKKEKTFAKVENLYLLNEENRAKEVIKFYNEHRNDLKVDKYIKLLKQKIETHFFHPKLFLEQLDKVNRNMHDLQAFEKNLFDKKQVSDVESDDSDELRMIERNKEIKRRKKIKIKKSIEKNKFQKKPYIEPKQLVDFIKENSDFIARYINFNKERVKRRKEKNHDNKVI